jgi:protoporphyrinogen oxidase
MEYDYIIIGAGISSLYTAYNLIKKYKNNIKFLILEKNSKKHIGGRMNVYNFYGTNVNIGAGVGRKEKDFLLINLLNELKIKYNEGKQVVNYDENVKRIDLITCHYRVLAGPAFCPKA